jgi:hypothetical protein
MCSQSPTAETATRAVALAMAMETARALAPATETAQAAPVKGWGLPVQATARAAPVKGWGLPVQATARVAQGPGLICLLCKDQQHVCCLWWCLFTKMHV